MVNLLFSPKARADLDQIWQYSIDNWSELSAATYLRSIFEAAERIKHNPLLGRAREDIRPKYRSLIIGSHIIFYKFSRENVTIIRILHQKMDVGAIS